MMPPSYRAAPYGPYPSHERNPAAKLRMARFGSNLGRHKTKPNNPTGPSFRLPILHKIEIDAQE